MGGGGIDAEILDPRQSALLYYTFFPSFFFFFGGGFLPWCFNGRSASGVGLIRISVLLPFVSLLVYVLALFALLRRAPERSILLRDPFA
jgi:uncharacterized membrane protein